MDIDLNKIKARLGSLSLDRLEQIKLTNPVVYKLLFDLQELITAHETQNS